MVRWEPGARERLQSAALDLFLARGFDQTTVQDIASAAGLTERTFFRHFADKREVLFFGREAFEAAFTDAVAAAPAGAPAALVGAALVSAAAHFSDERRPWSRRRQAVIEANAALRERELLKLADLGAAVAKALRARGVAEPAATLAAELGVSVFGIAFGYWIADGEQRSLVEIEREILRESAALRADLADSPLETTAGAA